MIPIKEDKKECKRDIMKKFFMITPLQPVLLDSQTGAVVKDLLCSSIYQAAGNRKLVYQQETRFPIIPVINGYAQEGEEIRVIAVTPDTKSAWYHVDQLKEELADIQERKKFICRGVEAVRVTYAGDVETQIEIFQKLLPFVEDGDILYGCLTYGNKPMPIAELMAIQYGYRTLRNVSIGCLVYGEVDHSREDAPMTLFDITALIRLDEIVRVLADRKVRDPKAILDRLIRE